MTPPVDPILLRIAGLPIRWYGVLITAGILLGANVATYLARRAGRRPETIWDMLMLAVVFAIIGARLYHVFSQPAGGMVGWDYYRTHPLHILYIWQGGLGIYGAIVGGALGVLLFCWMRDLNPLRWLDFAAPGMAVGQAIGRWGNYINQELYGPPTTLPWGLRIPPTHRFPPYNDLQTYPPDTLFHPTFLYESLAALALFLLLFWIAERYRAVRRPGDLFFGYLIGYSVIRFFTEMLRPDAWVLGTMPAAQIVALVLIVIGSIALVIRHWKAGRQ